MPVADTAPATGSVIFVGRAAVEVGLKLDLTTKPGFAYRSIWGSSVRCC